ncbi:class I adenylate-forming enzyme family protein [Leekyejoonella antrihumi]|nr:class I adenylate-forming enzyme family protein [Leekyejoonella antrihumi]
MSEPTTLTALLRTRAQGPERPFLLTADGPVTYADLDAMSDRFATALHHLGLRKGDRIGVAAPNGIPWLVTWFAASKIGCILVTLNVVYREQEFRHMLRQSGARAVVCVNEFGGFEFEPFLDRLLPQTPSVEHAIFIGRPGTEGRLRFEELLQTPADPAVLRQTAEPDDASVILYTSGTTGEPKGAVLTHASILASARGQVDRLAQAADDVTIGHMPLTHVGGMTCTIASTLEAGGRVSLVPSFNPKQSLELIARDRITIMVGVPTMFGMILSLLEANQVDTSSVRVCVIGGSNVEPTMAQHLKRAFPGARLANLYGLSECSGASVISRAEDGLQTITDTIGAPLAGVEARIVDGSGQPLPPDTIGELQIRGDAVAQGYWDLPETTARTFSTEGWLSTGDVAVLTEDGHVSLRGRLKEMYVRGGYNVYPAEIENLLAVHPSVAMSAIVGVPDAKWGETGHAFVVAREGAVVDVEALRELCETQLAEYKVPDGFTVVDSLPLTPAGKIRKVELRDRAVESPH